jgi:hypothetical protein
VKIDRLDAVDAEVVEKVHRLRMVEHVGKSEELPPSLATELGSLYEGDRSTYLIETVVYRGLAIDNGIATEICSDRLLRGSLDWLCGPEQLGSLIKDFVKPDIGH